MTANQQFDCIVLGAGPGGYVAAIKLAQLGKSVALIEEKYWGGVCLNVGCIPTKALLKNAEVAELVNEHAESYGISGAVSVDYAPAFQRSRQVSEQMAKGIHFLMKKNGVTQFQGRGSFLSPTSLAVTQADGDLIIDFDYAVIATGASPRAIPGIKFGPRIVDYEDQILQSGNPESIAIIGAGPIGVEFSFLLSSFGTKVTLLEAQDRVLPLEDEDVSKEMLKVLRKKGVVVMTSAKLQTAVESADAVTLTVLDSAGETVQLQTERVMISIGFAPNLEGYGLENTGVQLTENRAIAVDGNLRTSVDHIYAVGDVTAKLQLAHVAEAQGITAAEAICAEGPEEIVDYMAMPRAIFTNPQVASFGRTQAQLEAMGMELLVSKFPMAANGKAHALGGASGFVKLLADAKTRKLLGGHIVAADASEYLAELTLGHRLGLTVDQMVQNVHIHPTLSEAVQEALHGLAGKMINA